MIEKLIILAVFFLLAVAFTFKHPWIDRIERMTQRSLYWFQFGPKPARRLSISKGVLRAAGYVMWLIFVLTLLAFVNGSPLGADRT
ncbi:hypothetical protein [Thiosocius teredinicola]|uniref:hypothetical protein n=1 Tax=Thiosocius teredinicola TaxID=1973002 RepID=UPI0009912B1C